ncbi:aminodeoxychorismate synthase component I [Acidovorax sp. SUPP2522]|uniref:aminodeoxychorismate synthase component I n=1 Tax=unclassified Acidovorax TaxID=2684926 RepID=UPI0023496592|nr:MULTISPECIES: aminodeoxychorismate synthase component I [unclassified Acidovorax]WCM96781.1 aminodeoxychorismate synthase component I [Acidovorax sp. GBBC 1281]GKT14823.1 aminodeoxychorismate synthase component I [Acidovorax sp. SUPP2522]
MNFRIDFSDPRHPAGPRLRHAFGTPRRTLVAQAPHEVRAVLDAAEAEARAGAWCLGYLRYEAAGAFDAALRTHPADGPLAWFAVFDRALPWPDPPVSPGDGDGGGAGAPTVDWHTRPQRAAFEAALAHLHQAIAAGEFYQVNYTAPIRGTVSPVGGAQAALPLFAALQRAQPGGYAACIDGGAEQILSVSPELFFDWRGGSLLARPMKGTAPRGATAEDDAAQAAALRASPKERAENVMIVDLLRNDLSRIAEPHSVRVPALFHTEALPAVWQMTSDVEASTRAGTTLADVFAALFPCGSITGAPKVRAMQAIHALEPAPRGVYCGAVGIVRPDGEGAVAATFNVPIRTVTLRGQDARCGIGSGITSGAQAAAEWQEWQHKSAFLQRASAPFDLLETLALEDGVLRHRADHVARLAASAAHFGHAFDAARVHACLNALAQAHPAGLWRARLLLDAAAHPRAEAWAMAPTAVPVRLQLATRPLEGAHGEFVRHKTTRRAHYDAFTPEAEGVFDTLLWNEAGEITECTRGCIAALRADGRWVTPPLSCGLLPGVGRAVALREGRVTEAVLRVEEVPQVRAWAFVNSLRGWLDATLQA